ncbi:hypothetical protein BBOV_III003780 [Babesia bovis T2Bo]|uniref:CERLI1-like PH domain-containing protein n=1 Tax=Babesia bovis TaxID=5865 RepID=A7AN07_BABBO|nr:hypothetical protein BBOV_III003780 [Babesia bovis T2Bo]EDO07941.1 hypothetical protein BBOV_III003780 [Babesia bovis T2Bo]|eukprot:XP_001611509.1 hypothetical protein [Babesia bovis T2Bo]
MFYIDPQAVGCCAVGCCALAAGHYIANNLSKLPHPSECGCIGGIYRLVGLHDHDSLDIILELHEAAGYIESGKYYFVVEAGRTSYRSLDIISKDGKLQIHEKMKVHVRQCDDYITLMLYKRQLMRDVLCAELKLSVVNDLMAERLAKRRWFSMVHDSRTSTKIMVSIYQISDEMASRDLSPLALQAIIEAQQDGTMMEEDIIEELENMDDYAKLRFYSKVISGPLKKMNTFGSKWTMFYFKPLEISNGNWEWCAWHSREDYDAGLEAVETYPFLSISVVVADPSNTNCFYIKYHNNGEDFGLLFKRVDRGRDVWSDSLYEFIQRVRDIYFKNPNREKFKISHKRVKRSKHLELSQVSEEITAENRELKTKLAMFRCLRRPVHGLRDDNVRHEHVSTIL